MRDLDASTLHSIMGSVGWGIVSLRKSGPADSQDQEDAVAKLEERITVDAEQCGGRPCVRGMRIRVTDVLDLLAAGLTPDQVLRDLPDLESEDIHACLRFASRRVDHPVVAT